MRLFQSFPGRRCEEYYFDFSIRVSRLRGDSGVERFASVPIVNHQEIAQLSNSISDRMSARTVRIVSSAFRPQSSHSAEIQPVGKQSLHMPRRSIGIGPNELEKTQILFRNMI